MSDQPSATFLAEFGCERRCQVELDLTDWRTRMTYGQMLGRAEVAHKAAHQAEPVRVFVHCGDATVRAGAL